MTLFRTLALTLGLMLPTLALAKPPPGPRGDRPPPPLHEVIIDQADALGLSQAQVDAVQTAADGFEERARAAHEQMRSARRADDPAAQAAAHAELEALREDVDAALQDALGADDWARVQAALPAPPPAR